MLILLLVFTLRPQEAVVRTTHPPLHLPTTPYPPPQRPPTYHHQPNPYHLHPSPHPPPIHHHPLPPHHPTTPYPAAHPPPTHHQHPTIPPTPTTPSHPHSLAPYSHHETPRFPPVKCSLESHLASHPPHFYWCKPHAWWYYLWCEIFITSLFSNFCDESNYSLIKFSPYPFIFQVKVQCPAFIVI